MVSQERVPKAKFTLNYSVSLTESLLLVVSTLDGGGVSGFGILGAVVPWELRIPLGVALV